ncbi:16S rRNA (guanine(527)-N(7))-methyltransferase RsmG [Algisphaera agarilytica]|uniref:Ribosomal RNA small subunit methyltransferase G n=1 Tax=Algisphaera agarilytica TaxID=1385975 RepID=A0A7X0HBM2_9BACT|nr:16S rRNA (guanine(527)-N(7))-methyltransferase RsmG [Algisphaera agarilytica]MBB6431439.1 16S rRNA (guanine527-N7)-methyltransferase [Algisphaera agarilytica]
MAIPEFVHTDLQALGFEMPTEVLDKLEAYLDLILKANETTNLTAIRHREQAWSRLIVDSLTPLPGIPEDGDNLRLIDIGTGAGLPGIPLAIARPDVQVTLLEATGKKIAFLQSVIDALDLTNTQTLQERAETAAQDPRYRGKFDVVTNRAVGPMPVVLEYSLPMLKVGGRLLAMKGPKAEAELDASGDALIKLGGGEVAVVDAYPESFDNELVIVSVIKEAQTPKDYPRLPGLPKKQPL